MASGLYKHPGCVVMVITLSLSCTVYTVCVSVSVCVCVCEDCDRLCVSVNMWSLCVCIGWLCCTMMLPWKRSSCDSSSLLWTCCYCVNITWSSWCHHNVVWHQPDVSAHQHSHSPTHRHTHSGTHTHTHSHTACLWTVRVHVCYTSSNLFKGINNLQGCEKHTDLKYAHTHTHSLIHF